MVDILVLSFSSIVAATLAGRTAWALRRYEYRPLPLASEYDNFPTLSVCIAARNEVHALSQCLERVLQSDYPRLEILVLDDSSEDDTPHIIKSFAHAGVRFIAGRDIPEGWLGKNHAYQTLALEASGEYILFLDVDAVLKTHTISQLMQQLLANKRSMLSVLPRREDSYRLSAIFGSLRYFWSLILATKNTPPSASTLWCIKRTTLLELEKGLPDYGGSVRPEAHIARHMQMKRDYYYLIGTRSLGVGIEKRWLSQVQTAIRLYYPIAGYSPLRAAVSVLAIMSLLVPLYYLVRHASSFDLFFLWALLIIVAVFGSYAAFTLRTSGRKAIVLRLILWPYIVAQEVILLVVSIYRYGTNSVSWKGRPVRAQPKNMNQLIIDE